MTRLELQIGDYVWYKDRDTGIKHACEVIGLSSNGRICIWFISHRVDACYTEIEPIPLTAEILERNGWEHEFDKTDYMVKYDLGKEGKNCWMMWSIKEHNLDVQRQDEKLNMYNLKVSRVVIPCDYVHQLQQALRICGIKKINLTNYDTGR